MFCRNCGKELKEGSSFCSNCGFPVNENSVGMIPKASSNIGEESVNKELSLNNSETEPVDESKKKWSTADTIEAIVVGIPTLVLTVILIKLWVLPDFSLITFLPYCLLCFMLAASVFEPPFFIIALIYYAIKSNLKKTKQCAIGIAIYPVLGVVSFILLTNKKIFGTVVVILLIVGAVLDKMGLPEDKDKKENKEK